MNENHVYDMIIVGGGPGGYTSALYAARAGLDTIVIEKLSAGGQMSLTWQIDNYPGFENGIDGFSLAEKMQKQAEKFGAKSEYAEVYNMDLTGKLKRVETSSGIYIGKTVVIATGANPRELGLAKEKELIGHGVAYCASCDGMFYKDKIVVVVGGGNSAVSDIIKGLIVGKKYKMTETKPADGYVTAESIEFTVENTKEVQKHQMLDDVTKVEISKKDITDSSEVPGAKLIILDKDGKKVESWTSKDKPHMVEKLPVGEYTLREEQAPDGYLIAEDVKFTVKDTGKVQKVKMKDAHPYGKLVIKKTDSTSKAALSGAEFELREKESGKVVEKLVTDKTGTATSGKIPIATYKNGKVEKTVEYILVETKAPNGYELSSKKEEIRFEYKDGKTKVIEIVKEIKNTKSPSGSTPTGNSPKTGDSTNIWLPILLAVLSACGIGGVIWYKKKKGN